ncbi:hypothetical protein BS78_01G449200 [Paspalum vaginatum]|nr:hypothetical protein BS78_01G449200 [Paspalum vaginatum]KAJ1298392.1 hypothetical protein BS78_01G449200 [Paspalum vaginatum]
MLHIRRCLIEIERDMGAEAGRAVRQQVQYSDLVASVRQVHPQFSSGDYFTSCLSACIYPAYGVYGRPPYIADFVWIGRAELLKKGFGELVRSQTTKSRRRQKSVENFEKLELKTQTRHSKTFWEMRCDKIKPPCPLKFLLAVATRLISTVA